MKIHIIENNRITATIMATAEEAQSAFPGAVCVEAKEGGVGDTWDPDTGKVIPALPPEISIAEWNAPLLEQLEEIDRKSIRALREGNADRIESLEQQAAAVRAQLRK